MKDDNDTAVFPKLFQSFEPEALAFPGREWDCFTADYYTQQEILPPTELRFYMEPSYVTGTIQLVLWTHGDMSFVDPARQNDDEVLCTI